MILFAIELSLSLSLDLQFQFHTLRLFFTHQTIKPANQIQPNQKNSLKKKLKLLNQTFLEPLGKEFSCRSLYGHWLPWLWFEKRNRLIVALWVRLSYYFLREVVRLSLDNRLVVCFELYVGSFFFEDRSRIEDKGSSGWELGRFFFLEILFL